MYSSFVCLHVLIILINEAIKCASFTGVKRDVIVVPYVLLLSKKRIAMS